MNTKELQKKIVKFRDARDWKQFHNPKDLSISLLLEAAELLEHFQWKSQQEMDDLPKTKEFGDVKEEVADIYYWVLLVANDLNIDLEKEFLKKMKQNEKKYPIEKARGSHKKYTELT